MSVKNLNLGRRAFLGRAGVLASLAGGLEALHGAQHKNGALTLSRTFVEPTWGPLVYIGAGASTEAVTSVPEPSTLALLGLGTVFVFRCTRRGCPSGR